MCTVFILIAQLREDGSSQLPEKHSNFKTQSENVLAILPVSLNMFQLTIRSYQNPTHCHLNLSQAIINKYGLDVFAGDVFALLRSSFGGLYAIKQNRLESKTFHIVI